MAVALLLLGSCASLTDPPKDGGVSATIGTKGGLPARSPTTSQGAPKGVVLQEDMYDATIAFQVSHQSDTGSDGWEEWAISGDITLRALAQIDFASTVLAWDLDGDLYGTNRYEPRPTNVEAFDTEVGLANRWDTDIFISIHNNGAAPSGVMAIVDPSDVRSERLAARLLYDLSRCTGLQNRGVHEVRMYSLEQPLNAAPFRILLELGDNAADRRFLEDPRGRAALAFSIVRTLHAFVGRRYPSTDQSPRTYVRRETFAYRDPRQVLATADIGPIPHEPWTPSGALERLPPAPLCY